MTRCFREPINALTHGAGILLAAALLPLLVWLAGGKPLPLTAALIFSISSIILFSASSVFHSVQGGIRTIAAWRLVDHSAIYVLIAGTYTPVLLLALYPSKPTWALTLLITVWFFAVLGIAAKVSWRNAPRWLSTALYLGLGWLAVLGGGPLLAALAGPPIWWLFAGGLAYTVGAVVYATKWPRLWPGTFGFHELWHLFVLAGWACHAVVVWLLLLR